MPIQNAEIAAIFDEIADLLEIEGANPFRVRAYRNAARTIGSWGRSLQGMVERGGDPDAIPGIGPDLAGKIKEVIATGSCALLTRLRKEHGHAGKRHSMRFVAVRSGGITITMQFVGGGGMAGSAPDRALIERRALREHSEFEMGNAIGGAMGSIQWNSRARWYAAVLEYRRPPLHPKRHTASTR